MTRAGAYYVGVFEALHDGDLCPEILCSTHGCQLTLQQPRSSPCTLAKEGLRLSWQAHESMAHDRQ